jgi:hypothetical protein
MIEPDSVKHFATAARLDSFPVLAASSPTAGMPTRSQAGIIKRANVRKAVADRIIFRVFGVLIVAPPGDGYLDC